MVLENRSYLQNYFHSITKDSLMCKNSTQLEIRIQSVSENFSISICDEIPDDRLSGVIICIRAESSGLDCSFRIPWSCK